jgi:short-subunit dehydrogenase
VQVRGEFLDADLERLQTELDVNVSAVLRMTHLALSGMVARGHGAVVIVSSFAGILPARGSAYGASRAWAVALADTVAPSLRGTGAQITVVCPGFVRTASLRTIPRDAGFRQRFLLLAPEQVARCALADLRAGRTVSVPGAVYRGVWTGLELPRRALRTVARLTGHGRDRPRVPGPVPPALPVPRQPVGSSPVRRQPTP